MVRPASVAPALRLVCSVATTYSGVRMTSLWPGANGMLGSTLRALMPSMVSDTPAITARSRAPGVPGARVSSARAIWRSRRRTMGATSPRESRRTEAQNVSALGSTGPWR